MKLFPKRFGIDRSGLQWLGALALIILLAHALPGSRDVYSAPENVVANTSLEHALYRPMTLPAGDVMARRAPVESRVALAKLIQESPRESALYAIRAQEDERQLDFTAAEAGWKQAVNLAPDKRSALIDLANFYHRRLEPRSEVETLLRAANLPSGRVDTYRSASAQLSWSEFRRALDVCTQARLPLAIRNGAYEAWIKRYPRHTDPWAAFFNSLIEDGNADAARALAARIHAAFPDDLHLLLTIDSRIGGLTAGANAALSTYDKAFTPLWPADIRTNYYQLLAGAHQLRVFLANAHAAQAASPTALDPVLRAFFYFEQQGKLDLADQQLLQLESRRAAANSAWQAEELQTVAPLFVRVRDYDEAAHAYYQLFELGSASRDAKEAALASLADLLLEVPEQSLQFGARDLSIYRNIATMDRHPGFLNGILSLALNTTFPHDQYQSASQTAVAYFHRGIASGLIDRLKREFPATTRAPALEAKLFSAYALYGQNDAIMRLVPVWLAANPKSSDYTASALLLADSYSQTKRTAQEFALYDGLLAKLANESGHQPLGDGSSGGEEAPNAAKLPARSPDYARVLDLYISRLTQLKRRTDAVALYRREIDRNPDDPGIYERLCLFVEANHLDAELEQTYRAAMARFDTTSWPDKLARFYLRKRQVDAYTSLTRELTDKLDGSKLGEILYAVPPDHTFSPALYRQVNLYAHARFPHNLVFVQNLLNSYETEGLTKPYEQLLRENCFYDSDLRARFFQYLSRTNKLRAELAALPAIDDAVRTNNTAALAFHSDGRAWLASFEEAAPAYVKLAALTPGDREANSRAISVERSLAPSVPGAFDTAIQLAERGAKAEPNNAAACTLVGEIYTDRELYFQAAPWWNRISSLQPGSRDGYLDGATVFWDYFQFDDSLRLIQDARHTFRQPALFGYEAGAIQENKGDYQAAIVEYLQAALAAKPESDEQQAARGNRSLAQQRLVTLAQRKNTAAEVELRTMALVDGKPFNPAAFDLRLALLEAQGRRADVQMLLLSSVEKIGDLEQLASVRQNATRLGFENVQQACMQRTIALSADPIEKLAARIELANFYEAHQQAGAAANELNLLLAENPNLLGVVRANVDFYWRQKQPQKAVVTLEAAAGRATQPYRNLLQREAAQKAADSSDFKEARRLLDILLSADPFNGDLLAAKASTYAREGDNNALIDFYATQLTQLNSASLPADEKTTRVAALRRGYIGALVTAEDFNNALEQYQALINVYPEDAGLATEAAHFAETNHLADKLTSYYAKATADSPRDYRWPLVLARLDTALRRYPEAIAAFEKAAYVRPDRVDLFLARADLETRLLRFEAAIKTYQKIYDLSYHDSQYLASQATLYVRLGKNPEAIRLLSAAYIDPYPKELNGYVKVMGCLLEWRMYDEADRVFQRARPLIGAGNGDFQQAVTREAQALTALRRPIDALNMAAEVSRTTKDPKDPWDLAPQVNAIGATVDELFTPEEKQTFAQDLETAQRLPREFNINDLARACGFAELSAQHLYQSALKNPPAFWPTLRQLEADRLRYAELGRELEALTNSAAPPEVRIQIQPAAAEAYRMAGDPASELRMIEALNASGTPPAQPAHYAQLLIETGADLSQHFRQLPQINTRIADAVVQELLMRLPEDKAREAIAALGRSGLWTRSYSALTGLFFLSSNDRTVSDFDSVLGPRTINAQLASGKQDALRGDVWFYYAARYGDYLSYTKRPGAAEYLPASLEANASASSNYAMLGESYRDLGQLSLAMAQYEQALTLSPNRADVHDLVAEAEWAQQHRQRAIDEWHTAFHLLALRVEQGRLPEDYYSTAKLVLVHMNVHGLARDLKPDADAMLRAYIKRNGAYHFTPFLEGILEHAADRKQALAWILDVTRAPEMSSVLAELLESHLLAREERELIYLANIDRKRQESRDQMGNQDFLNNEVQGALSSYAQYLAEESRNEDAWRVVNEIEPASARPADLLLRLAALTGRLNQILTQYGARTLTPPGGEQFLTVAGALAESGHADLARQLEEYEYGKELRGGNAPATAYFGLAQVRIEQKRNNEALALIRDVTLSVGAPFENLPAATALLEKAGLKENAAAYAREWRTAVPWNPEAQLAFSRITADPQLLNSVRGSSIAPYGLRVRAAESLRGVGPPAAGPNELDLLTHQTISIQEARQPFFVQARLRAAAVTADAGQKADLYAESIALRPSLQNERLALALAAFGAKRDALGLAAWDSYASPDTSAREQVAELAAAALVRRSEFEGAITLYDRILDQTKDEAVRARVAALRKQTAAESRLDQLNHKRLPAISKEMVQSSIVKPKLVSLPEGGGEQ